MRLDIRVGLVAFLAACDQPGVQVRAVEGPAQRTMGELRKLHGSTPVPCALPAVDPAPAGVVLTSLDGRFRVVVAGRWPAEPVVETSRHVLGHGPRSRWTDDRRRAIVIELEENGLSGPRTIEDSSHPLEASEPCEVAAGDAGAIWRFYSPVPPDTSMRPFPHIGLAEMITRDSLRYRIEVSAVTASARDSLARIVSDAAMGQSAAAASGGA